MGVIDDHSINDPVQNRRKFDINVDYSPNDILAGEKLFYSASFFVISSVSRYHSFGIVRACVPHIYILYSGCSHDIKP